MKSRMKKVGVVLGTVVLGASMMTACGGKKAEQPASTSSSSHAASSVVEESASSASSAVDASSILDEISESSESESKSESSSSAESGNAEEESGDDADSDSHSTEASVVGKYEAAYDMKDLLNSELGEAGIELKGAVNAVYQLELKDDGTFVFGIDGASFSEEMKKTMTEQGPDIVKAMFAAEGITEESFAEIAEASGYDSYDEFVNSMVEDMKTEMGGSMADEMNEAAHVEGTYAVEGKTLALSATAVEGEEEKPAIENGEIQDDGSIRIVSHVEGGSDVELNFVKI